MCSLKASVQEVLEYNREQEWRRAGVPESDIRLSRLSGMDGRDVQTFREFSQQGYLIIVRCPKVTARAWHGKLPPKNVSIKAKTGTAGIVEDAKGRLFVSDYDLMCVWRRSGAGFAKIFMSAAGGAPRGRWGKDAQALAVSLNQRLVSRIQHGCQDDFDSPMNPGVKGDDHFAAFREGAAEHLANPTACARYYARAGIPWPYAPNGHYLPGGGT